MALLCAHALSQEPVVVALDHWPPLIDDARDGGTVRGIEVDLLDELFKRAGMEYIFRICPWTRCLKMAQHRKIGMLTHASYKKDRESFLYYLRPAYYEKDIRVFVMRKGEGKKIKNFDDLYKLKIGIVQDISYGERFDREMKEGKLRVSSGNENRDFLQLVLHGRLDAFIDTKIMVLDQIRRDSLTGKLELAEFKIESDNKLFFAMVKGVISDAQSKKLTIALESMKSDGTMKRLLQGKK